PACRSSTDVRVVARGPAAPGRAPYRMCRESRPRYTIGTLEFVTARIPPARATERPRTPHRTPRAGRRCLPLKGGRTSQGANGALLPGGGSRSMEAPDGPDMVCVVQAAAHSRRPRDPREHLRRT